ncbi:MAG: aa3-type cytochrome c oxidase subunit IV [Pseudomonadota bacterium]
MAGSEYTHGEMNIAEQQRTFDGFITGTIWGSAILIMVVGYATLTLAGGMHWMIALALTAGAGIAGGAFMGMGVAWIAAVIGMTALAVVLQVLISLFSLLT